MAAMCRTRATALAVLWAGLLAGLVTPIVSPAGARWPRGRIGAQAHSLLQSRELWATVDVCAPADRPHTVGIRGSMPGDGSPKDAMYMRFRLQYLEAKSNAWVNLAHGGDSGFIAVGPAKVARQGGTSFQLMAVSGSPGYALRGVVTFQWRHGSRIVHEASRTTSAGHRGVADADPPGYSAAQCTIA